MLNEKDIEKLEEFSRQCENMAQFYHTMAESSKMMSNYLKMSKELNANNWLQFCSSANSVMNNMVKLGLSSLEDYLRNTTPKKLTK